MKYLIFQFFTKCPFVFKDWDFSTVQMGFIRVNKKREPSFNKYPLWSGSSIVRLPGCLNKVK